MINPSHWPADWDGGAQLQLLRDIIGRRQPELRSVVDIIGERRLHPDEREALRTVVSDEMLSGPSFDAGWDFTPWGDQLDGLIEWLGKVSRWDIDPSPSTDNAG